MTQHSNERRFRRFLESPPLCRLGEFQRVTCVVIAGRAPSHATNPRRSIDGGFVSKIQVLVTWSAGTIRGCPITVEAIANAKPTTS